MRTTHISTKIGFALAVVIAVVIMVKLHDSATPNCLPLNDHSQPNCVAAYLLLPQNKVLAYRLGMKIQQDGAWSKLYNPKTLVAHWDPQNPASVAKFYELMTYHESNQMYYVNSSLEQGAPTSAVPVCSAPCIN